MNHVDTTEQLLSHISLCFGYGGIDLGLHRVLGDRLRLAAVCEIEAFAVENALAKMEAGQLPPAPIWTDLRTFPWEHFLGVDLVSGGFPCQPFSAAGKRAGDEDPRHLFPYILDGIRRCRPSLVFLENVEGILSSKLAGDGWRDPAGTPVLLHVFRELERIGYKATAGVFSASEVGAPHQRKRVFILAHRQNERLKLWSPERWESEDRSEWATIRDKSIGQSGASCELAHGNGNGSPSGFPRQEQGHEGIAGIADHDCGQGIWPSRPGEPQHEWEPPRVVQTHVYGGGGLDDATNSNDQRCEPKMGGERNLDGQGSSQMLKHRGADGLVRVRCKRQTQPPLGGDPDGSACGVDYAELQESNHSCGGERSCTTGGELGNTDNNGRVQLDSIPRGGTKGKQSNGGECEAVWSSADSAYAELGNSKHSRLHGSEVSRGIDSASNNNPQGEDNAEQLERASQSDCYANLCVACDNRTDELRLLGNGVVPATAERAFKVLFNQLMGELK